MVMEVIILKNMYLSVNMLMTTKEKWGVQLTIAVSSLDLPPKVQVPPQVPVLQCDQSIPIPPTGLMLMVMDVIHMSKVLCVQLLISVK